ncbi:DUF1801 domain-containing protein [Hahella ganghwensis]|uniref:DUF1801 domain-containing protein n=1 Tax=Hahella ganghwensis TaxID=286420 RepID=UPI000372A434|nr:DUF1801 domain-containing protein [Hahella ganghwensis]
MTQNNPDLIHQFLEDIESVNADFHQVLLKLRRHFLSFGPDLEEGIKYGGLVFSRDGKLVGGIYVYKNHLSIEFSQGAEFDDPNGLLEGTGKFRRHLKFNSEKDIEANQSEFFIKQACHLKSDCPA